MVSEWSLNLGVESFAITSQLTLPLCGHESWLGAFSLPWILSWPSAARVLKDVTCGCSKNSDKVLRIAVDELALSQRSMSLVKIETSTETFGSVTV